MKRERVNVRIARANSSDANIYIYTHTKSRGGRDIGDTERALVCRVVVRNAQVRFVYAPKLGILGVCV